MLKEISFQEADTKFYRPKSSDEIAFITGLPLPETDFKDSSTFNIKPSALASGLLVFNMVNAYYADFCQVQIFTDSDPKHTTQAFCAHTGSIENQIPDRIAIQIAFKLLPSLLQNSLILGFNSELL